MATNRGRASSRSSTGGGRRGERLKSDVWRSFRYLHRTGPNEEDKAECIKCHSRLRAGSRHGTTHLRRHINSQRCSRAVAEEAIDDDFFNALPALLDNMDLHNSRAVAEEAIDNDFFNELPALLDNMDLLLPPLDH